MTVYLFQIRLVGRSLSACFGTVALWFAKSDCRRFTENELHVPFTARQAICRNFDFYAVFRFAASSVSQTTNLLAWWTGEQRRRIDGQTWIVARFVWQFVGLAVWQAGSLIVGTFFPDRARSDDGNLYLWRGSLTCLPTGENSARFHSQALNALYRRASTAVIIAVGLGAFVVCGAVFTVKPCALIWFYEISGFRFVFHRHAKKSMDNWKFWSPKIRRRTGNSPTIRARSRRHRRADWLSNREVRQQQGQIGRDLPLRIVRI